MKQRRPSPKLEGAGARRGGDREALEQPLAREPASVGRPRDPAADEAILRAAFDLFLEDGPSAVSFEHVASRAGVSRAAVYRRWQSRDDLLAAALWSARAPVSTPPETVARMSLGQLADFLAATILDALERPELGRFIAAVVGSIYGHPRVLAIYRERFIGPLWRAVAEVTDRARAAEHSTTIPEADMLLGILSGAVLQRVLWPARPPSRKENKLWVEGLLRQVGLRRAARRQGTE